jgi:hypothetical protein
MALVVLTLCELDRAGAVDGFADRAEGDQETVARRLYLAAAVKRQLAAHQLVVLPADRPGALVAAPDGELRRADYIGEQHREKSGLRVSSTHGDVSFRRPVLPETPSAALAARRL